MDAVSAGQYRDWASGVPRCSYPLLALPLRQPPAAMSPKRPWLPARTRVLLSAHNYHASHHESHRSASRPPREPPKAATLRRSAPQPPPTNHSP